MVVFVGHRPTWWAVPCNNRQRNTDSFLQMSSGKAVPYFYGKFRFRNWSCRYRNYFQFRWWKSDTSALPYRAGSSTEFPEPPRQNSRCLRAAYSPFLSSTSFPMTMYRNYRNSSDISVYDSSRLLIRRPKQTNQ